LKKENEKRKWKKKLFRDKTEKITGQAKRLALFLYSLFNLFFILP